MKKILLIALSMFIMPAFAVNFFGTPTPAELKYQPGLEYQLPMNADKDLYIDNKAKKSIEIKESSVDNSANCPCENCPCKVKTNKKRKFSF